ncbi:GNAT family N-acetyltransferase [Cellulomonas sp. P22]|uniref:GNAT family N-acetyltransferase n=1 Tax=Cellulomonas sp. P22 TaxID=3373189 RepID=UPI0037AC4F7F
MHERGVGVRDVDDVARLLGAALHLDPGFVHVLPDARVRAATLRSMYALAVHDALRSGHVTTAADSRGLAGVAVWYPPGSYPLTPVRWVRSLPRVAAVAARSGRRAPALLRLTSAVEHAVPADAWYLEALGVRPDAQRRGHGRRLVEQVLRLADEQRTACYLETFHAANVPYYAAMGFDVLGQAAPLLPGGPPVARMRREPRDRPHASR